MVTAIWSVPDCTSLVAEYVHKKQLYEASVGRLFAVGYQLADDEYARLKNSMEEARVQADLARRKLDKHTLAAHAKAV